MNLNHQALVDKLLQNLPAAGTQQEEKNRSSDKEADNVYDVSGIPQKVQKVQRDAEKETDALLKRNDLHGCLDEVQRLLRSPFLVQEYKGELIEALIEEKIGEELSMEKDGMEISFIPACIDSARTDTVLTKVRAFLQEMFKEAPNLNRIASHLLQQEVYEVRPFDFEGVDPQSLAYALGALAVSQFGTEQDLQVWQKKYEAHSGNTMPLRITKRGENIL